MNLIFLTVIILRSLSAQTEQQSLLGTTVVGPVPPGQELLIFIESQVVVGVPSALVSMVRALEIIQVMG